MAEIAKAVILTAVRTPVGKFQGGLSSLSAPQLGAKAVAEAVRRAGIEPAPSTKSSWATSCRPASDRIPRGRPRSAADSIRASPP